MYSARYKKVGGLLESIISTYSISNKKIPFNRNVHCICLPKVHNNLVLKNRENGNREESRIVLSARNQMSKIMIAALSDLTAKSA